MSSFCTISILMVQKEAPFAVMWLIAVCYRAVRRWFGARRGDKAGAWLWKMQLLVCRCSFHWIRASFLWRLAISYLPILFWDEAEGCYKVEQRLDASCNGQSDSQAHSLFFTDSFCLRNGVQIISVFIQNCKCLSEHLNGFSWDSLFLLLLFPKVYTKF